MQTDKAWKAWGEKDPYYGVLSHKSFRRENLADNLQGFKKTGETHWLAIRKIMERLYGPYPRHRAVDFGCGVGRILKPMSLEYDRVVGIDISPHMLAKAAEDCPGAELLLSDDRLSRLVGPVDLVHSFIVFQHIPPRRGLHMADELLKHLAPGGVAVLHFTLKRPPLLSKRIVYFMKHHVPGARFVFNLLQGKALSEPVMQMNEYDLNNITQIFQANKMKDIYLLPDRTGDTLSVIVFAQKDQ